MRFPIMGEVMLAFQTIFVDRDSHASGRGAAEQIAATLADGRFPQVGDREEGGSRLYWDTPSGLLGSSLWYRPGLCQCQCRFPQVGDEAARISSCEGAPLRSPLSRTP